MLPTHNEVTQSSSIIIQILELSGEMPDPGAHKRYLQGLTMVDLTARLKELQNSRHRSGSSGRGAGRVRPDWMPAIESAAQGTNGKSGRISEKVN